MKSEAEKRIREALADEALHDEGASVSDTLYAAHVFEEVCSPENIAALLADRDEREAKLRAELAHEEQRVADMMADVNRVGHENDALRAEVEALRNLLHRAGNELVCDGEVMSESDDEWTRSHACGRCDDYVDRNWPIRTEIRAALTQAKDAT